MPAEYLTQDEVVARLENAKGTKPLEQFRSEVERLSGMKISYSHLVNIMKKHRMPNETVLRYLGGSKEKIYQIDKPVPVESRRERGKR